MFIAKKKKKNPDSAKQVIRGLYLLSLTKIARATQSIYTECVHPNQLEIDDPNNRKHYKQRPACHRDEHFFF